MNFKLFIPLFIFLIISGCSTVGEVYDWAFDKDDVDEETVITEENKSQFEYVTVNIKDKIAVKVADPLGPRKQSNWCWLCYVEKQKWRKWKMCLEF